MSDVLGLSKEHEFIYTRMRCPLCGQAPIVPKYFDRNEKPIPFRTPYSKMDTLAIAECPKCRQRWSVFSGAKAGIVRTRMSEITLKGDQTKAANFNIGNQDIRSLNLLETERVEEHLGSETRIVDNSKSGITVTREFTISKEWSQSYTIDYDKTTALTGEVSGGLFNLASLKSNVQRTVKDHYSISEGTKLTYSEKIILQVNANTKLRVVFQWKRLWQHGILEILNKSGAEFKTPFRVAIGVTFDQVQIDE
jgi:hypothetical protein